MPFKPQLFALAALATDVVAEDYARVAIVIILTVGITYLAVVGRVIPTELLMGWSAVLGYYFGRGVTHGNS